jgi:putative endonuclease
MFANELRYLKPTTSNHPSQWSAPFPSGGEWLCYILCCGGGTLYTGITNDLEKRLHAHNTGTASKYTRAHGPVELVFVECCADKSSALKREMKIKGMGRSKKLALIKSASRPQIAARLCICSVGHIPD